MLIKLFILLGGLNYFSVGNNIVQLGDDKFISDNIVSVRMLVDQAASKLDNCGFFKTRYPKEYEKYVVWRIIDQQINLVATVNDYECAHTTPDSLIKILSLNPTSINDKQKCGTIVGVLAHEMLHLAKLPNHIFPYDKDSWDVYFKDVIPTIQKECAEK